MSIANAKPRPSRNPKYLLNRDGRYFARLVVPPDLRAHLAAPHTGRTELRTPLGPDRRTALQNLHIAVADLQSKLAVAERRHAEANRKPLPLAPRYPARPLDAAGAAAWTYRSALANDDRMRDLLPAYAQSTHYDLDALEELAEAVAGKLEATDLASVTASRMDALQRAGFALPDPGTPEWRGFARAVAAGALEGFGRIAERDEGEFGGTPTHPVLREGLTREEIRPVPLKALFLDYVADRLRVGKGRTLEKDWGPVINHLIGFVGHDDARRVTKRNLLDWRDHLLEDRAPRTVRMRYLAPVRSLYNWAKLEDRLDFNPADGVRQPLPKVARTREKGFTDPEARAVVAHSRAHAPAPNQHGTIVEFPETTAGKRWLPLLCAHTGARVGEMAQLRKEDVRREGAHHVLRITPDAGTVKAGGYRDVPVHPELVDLGFLDFVNGAKPGPLFYRSAKGQPSRTKAQKIADTVGRFLQAAHLVPEGVSPNHGWRHKFKTTARELGLSDRVVDAICGHVARTTGDDYGDVTVIAKARVIGEMPCLAS